MAKVYSIGGAAPVVHHSAFVHPPLTEPEPDRGTVGAEEALPLFARKKG